MSTFDEGRHETVRYHQDLYASTPLGTPGTWLARPHPLVLRAVALAHDLGPVTAYDLGAGVGRHTLAMARGLAEGSHVVAVDLLPSAIGRLLDTCAAEGFGDVVTGVAQDLEAFTPPRDAAGLVVGFSAIEHVSSLDALAELLRRCVRGTRPGGVHAFGLVTDRCEVLSDGTARPALVEQHLTAAAAYRVLEDTYRLGWVVEHRRSSPSRTVESRDGVAYELTATLVEVIARRVA